MVFDPAAAPLDREEFLSWYEQQTSWSEEHDYDDPSVSSASLRSWFLEMIEHFPAMNGPHASHDDDSPRVTDYSVGKSVIYAAFAWSQAKDAHRMVVELAKKHRIGFFDASSDENSIWRPETGVRYDVFYCFHAADEFVPSDTPVLMGLNRIAGEMIDRLKSDQDFIGLVDANGTTLQVLYHLTGDHYWMEIPSPEQNGAYGAFVDRQKLRMAVENLPEFFTLDAFPEFSFEPWGRSANKKWWQFWR